MYACPCSPRFIDTPTPFWLIEVHVIPLTAFTPVCLYIRLPLARCTSRPPTDPIVASLASVERAGTLKECKAADQSGLERECTQRPSCEGFLSLFFLLFFCNSHPCLPRCRAFLLPASRGKRYHCVIAPDGPPGALGECNRLFESRHAL